jgi:hypothetical protein
MVEDFIEAGLPAATPAQRLRLEMVADGVTALTETMAMGHLEGRYPDLEEVVDTLVAFFAGVRAQLLSDRSG